MTKPTTEHIAEVLPPLRREYLFSRVLPENLKIKEARYT
jgi:hypothetical protein